MELISPFPQCQYQVNSAVLTSEYFFYAIVFISNLVTLHFINDSSLGL